MGYYVRTLPWKKSKPSWKVQFVSYKKDDFNNAQAVKPKKEWDVSPERWRSLGFQSEMHLKDARARARQLNAQMFLKRQEERIRKIEITETALQRKYDSALPVEFVQEFEERFVRERDSGTEQGKRKQSRSRSLWQATQKMIIAIQIDPSEWFFYSNEIYDYFYRKQYSIKYTSAILKFANLWGFYLSRKLARPFLAVAAPRGFERQRIIDAYYKREHRRRRPSASLTPEVLKSTDGSLNRKNFNWLHLTVWLGLRPQEVDNLRRKDLWSVDTLANGRKVLSIFQTKIVALPPEDRWKPIPILFDEQEQALAIIQQKNFKRPLIKTIRKHFGTEVDLYGGRKGFPDLMLSKGHSFENISIWMGHSTLERTWRSYKNKRKFHLAW